MFRYVRAYGKRRHGRGPRVTYRDDIAGRYPVTSFSTRQQSISLHQLILKEIST